MKKRILAGLLASATVVGMFAAGGTALAAPVDSAGTDVGIGFSDYVPGETPGPLEIKWAPIKFDFHDSNNYKSTSFNEKSGLKKYVVVSDDRTPATANKWELSAKLGTLMSGATPLTGATLKFDTDLQGYQGTVDPAATGSIIAPDVANTATVSAANFTLAQAGTAQVVMKDGDGVAGTYRGFSAFEMENIKLDVPSNVVYAGKQFTGKLTWSLDDTI